MGKEQNYARDIYALQQKNYLAQQQLNKPAYEATATWWDKLQEWENMPGYGALPVDWDDIWERAKEKVQYAYWGGPGGQPGLAGKVKASAARRGVSESPALETTLSRMGMQEAADLRQLATTQAGKEIEYGEKGRQNWLSSLQSLSARRSDATPPYPMPAAYGIGKSEKSGVSWPGLITGGLGAIGGSLVGPMGTAAGAAGGYALGSGIEDLFTGGGSDSLEELMKLYGSSLAGYRKPTTPGALTDVAGMAKGQSFYKA